MWGVAAPQDATGHTVWETNVPEAGVELLGILERSESRVIGWIHSHPTFDAFLSSIDQHMHYQLQREDARCVALVTDKDDQVKSFRLTDAGMAKLETCTEQGFHKHVDADGVEIEMFRR